MATKSPTITNSQGKTLYLSPSGHSYGATPPTTVTTPAPAAGRVLGASTDAPAGSLKDLSIALAPKKTSGGGSIQDLSIALANNKPITQADITRAQSGGPSLASLSSGVASSPVGSTPVSTPQGSNQTGIVGGGSKRYSRYGNQDEPVIQEPNLEQIQKQLTKNAQKEINSLYTYQNDLLREQQGINQQNDRSTASVNTLTGLAGSSEANIAQQATTQKGQQANQQIMNQVQTQVQGVLAKVRSDAQQQYQFERTQANADQQTRDAHEKVMRDNAQENVAMLAQSGATAEGYMKTDPEGYTHLAKTVGGEDVLKAMFTLNRPQDTILDKKIEGGKYVIAYKNPLTDAIRIETVDLGLPPQLSASADLGDRIMFYDPSDPTHQMFVNKGLTPAQQKPSSDSSPTVSGTNDPVVNSWVSAINNKTAKITDVPKNLKNAVIQAYAESTGTNVSQLSRDALTTVDKLITDFEKGKGAVGMSSVIPNIPGTDSKNYERLFEQFKSLLSLDNIKYLKGTGAISDAEQRMLANAATNLGLDMSETEFKNTLNTLKTTLGNASQKLDTTDTNNGTLTSPDGTQEVSTADLTPAELKEATDAGWK